MNLLNILHNFALLYFVSFFNNIKHLKLVNKWKFLFLLTNISSFWYVYLKSCSVFHNAEWYLWIKWCVCRQFWAVSRLWYNIWCFWPSNSFSIFRWGRQLPHFWSAGRGYGGGPKSSFRYHLGVTHAVLTSS